MDKRYRYNGDDYVAVVQFDSAGNIVVPGSGGTGGGGASTIVDGGDATQGAKADTAATNSTGSWTIVSILKGLYVQLGNILTGVTAPTPAGTNSIGTVGLNAGSATVGNVGLVAGSATVGNVGLVAGTASVGTVGLNAGTNAIGTVALTAGSATIGKITVPDGSDAATGTTTDAAWVSGSGTVVGILKGLFGALAGFLKVAAVVWYAEASGSSVAANATLTGTVRNNPAAAGTSGSYPYFLAECSSTVAGVMSILNSAGGIISTTSISANSGGFLKVPALGASFYAQFVCGATGGSVTLTTGYSAN